MSFSYARTWALYASTLGYLEARERGLAEAVEVARSLSRPNGDAFFPDVLDEAEAAIMVYGYGGVEAATPAPLLHNLADRVDYDIDRVWQMGDHVDAEGLYEGRRTGVCAPAAMLEELRDQQAQNGIGNADQPPRFIDELAELVAALSSHYGIAADAPPRYNHPAGV